jgi:diguanylate cyclase (GGDEF)-like protein
VENKLSEVILSRIEKKEDMLNDTISNENIEKILQELDIYEAELLAQNEELKEKEQQLLNSQAEYESLFTHAPVPYIIVNEKYVIEKYNLLANQYFGISRIQVKRSLFSFIPKECMTDILSWFENNNYENSPLIVSMKCDNKEIKKFQIKGVKYPKNEKWFFLSFIDADKEYRLKEKIEKDRQYLQNVIDGIQDPLRVIDKDFNVILMNSVAKSSINEKFIKDSESPKCYEVSHHISEPCYGEDHLCPLKNVLETDKPYSTLHNHFNKDNNPTLEQVTISPLKDNENNTIAYIEHCSDVTELVNTKEKLHFEKYYDSLTELPNKNKFLEILQESINEASRHNLTCCLINIDIDGLKLINESFGHQFGNEAIVQFAQWIKETIRQEDIVARLSGDNFVVLMTHVEDKLAPVRLIEKLQEKVVNSNIEVMYNKIHLGFNAGIAIYDQDGDSVESLLKSSDSALHEAKKSNHENFKFYDEEFTKKALDKIIIESNLKKAIKEKKFELFFQPQYNSKDDSLIGMEVLIRWQDCILGFVSPEKFVPYLENSGQINQVGNWIFESIFQTISKWKEKNYNFGRVSVNVSLNQLKHKEKFLLKLEDLMEKHNCEYKDIGLEITESTIMENIEETTTILEKLSKSGFYILIDDFGTGYSSLSHLKKMPINKLKIDKSFIDGILEDNDDKVITKTIIDLAFNLHLDIVAEGVETKEQLEFLKEHGCYDIQGYYYSKPLSLEDMEQLLEENKH